jgi:hypothetical protein
LTSGAHERGSVTGECVINKAIGTTDIDESLDAEIGRNIREMKRTGAALAHPANVKDKVSADSLGTLFRRVTKLSMSEVESVIDELQSDLIERAIARHSEHSQG